MASRNCTTCGTHVTSRKNFVEFDCPSCGETRILRCNKCKESSNKYKCNECEFVGP